MTRMMVTPATVQSAAASYATPEFSEIAPRAGQAQATPAVAPAFTPAQPMDEAGRLEQHGQSLLQGNLLHLPVVGEPVAQLTPEGDLLIQVGERVLRLEHFTEAAQHLSLVVETAEGHRMSIADVLADSANIDINTAAGVISVPMTDTLGHGLFNPFIPASLLGGLGEVSVLPPTDLQYGLIEPDHRIYIHGEDGQDPGPASGGDTDIVTPLPVPEDASAAVLADERYLTAGSQPDALNTVLSGTLSLPDGVTVQNPGTFVLQYGTLTVDVDGSFTYTLTGAASAAGDDRNIFTDAELAAHVTLVNQYGQTGTGTIHVGIVDDVPSATADMNSVFTDAFHSATSGNVITGAGETGGTGIPGADIQGADGGHVTQVSGVGGAVDVAGSGDTVITGAFGTLTIHGDGSYTYHQVTAAPNDVMSESFRYTLTDGDGDMASADLTIDVNHAPTVYGSGGSVLVPVTNLAITNAPAAPSNVADYLLNTSVDGTPISGSLINGINPGNLTMNASAPVSVDFQREGAGYQNMVGIYQYDASGHVIPGSVQFIWLNASQASQNVVGHALVTDFLGNSQPLHVDLGNYPAGTRFGFFTVVDAASSSSVQSTLRGVAGVSASANNYASDLAAINAATSIYFDQNGHGHVVVNGHQLSSDVLFSSDPSWNSAGNGSQQFISGAGLQAGDNRLYIGVEDTAVGGDRDFNDVVFAVNLGQENINHVNPAVFVPDIHLGDIDHDISHVTITTTGFTALDHLDGLFSNHDFTVSTTQHGADYTIDISGHGITSAQWESFLHSLTFSSTSTAETPRSLEYDVTDVSGHTAVTGIDVNVTVQHDASLSLTAAYHSGTQSGSNVTWGSGDDFLHLDSAFGRTDGHVDLGQGYNTVLVGANGINIDSTQASHLANVDHIDMTGYNGSGGNHVTLTNDDVLRMTESSHTLRIEGDSVDQVNLSHGTGADAWHDGGSVNGYHVYTSGAGTDLITVMIENEVQQHVS